MGKLIDECRTALIDGLGKSEAASYEVSEWDEAKEIGYAYSKEHKTAWLIFIDRMSFNKLSPSEYLDAAKDITERLGLLTVPANKATPTLQWGTKSGRGATAYRFKIY
ncbi:hypothetical protein [Stutzerimonas zhaodongensis]|jgi:hypothetical protein|uniref:hypothetical protein n=1 Tax=Stutzerimonas zhaodongensis TaxID=1176257 RepID=UPI001F4E8E79|nr:hypothetical protein [Stutzerimonas zhaodongensis]UNG17532.1 hypothetical protein MKP10_17175 [Stutzerimonas zhaodongensis]